MNFNNPLKTTQTTFKAQRPFLMYLLIRKPSALQNKASSMINSHQAEILVFSHTPKGIFMKTSHIFKSNHSFDKLFSAELRQSSLTSLN